MFISTANEIELKAALAATCAAHPINGLEKFNEADGGTFNMNRRIDGIQLQHCGLQTRLFASTGFGVVAPESSIELANRFVSPGDQQPQ